MRKDKTSNPDMTARFIMRMTPEMKDNFQKASDMVGMTLSDFSRLVLSLTSSAVLNASQDKEEFNRRLLEEFNMIARRLTFMFYAEQVKEEMNLKEPGK